MAKVTNNVETKVVTNNVGTKVVTKDIIDRMAEKSGAEGGVKLTKKEAAAAITYLEEAVIEYLATGASVQLTGFLTIQPSYRTARTGNNISTSEPIAIPETVVATAKAGKSLKDAMKDMDASIVTAIKESQKK